MMHTLGVTRDLGADHARRILIVGRAADPADRMGVEHLDFQRAGRRAVVRAGRCGNAGANELVHNRTMLSAAEIPVELGTGMDNSTWRIITVNREESP